MPVDLGRFFGPIPGSTIGAGGSGAFGDAHAGVAVANLDTSILGPFDGDAGADLWDTVWIGDIPLPPVGTGFATVKFTPSVKLTQNAKAGATKPRLVKTGGKATEGTVTVKFIHEAWPAMVAACKTLYPGQGPFKISHPKATLARVVLVEIESWGDAPDPDAYGVFTWSFKVVETTAAAQTGKGGATAVKTPKEWYNVKPGDIPIGSNGNTVGGFTGTVHADGSATKSPARHAADKKADAATGAQP